MQANMSNPVCPLCKKPGQQAAVPQASMPMTANDIVTNGAANGVANGIANSQGASRLCENCLSMIAIVRPQSSRLAFAGSSSSQPHAQPLPPPAREQTNGIPIMPFETIPEATTEVSFVPSSAPLHFEPASPLQPRSIEQPLEFENPFAPVESTLVMERAEPEPPAPQLQERFFAGQENLPRLQEAAPPITFQTIDYAPKANELALRTEVQASDMNASAKTLDATEINDIPASWDSPEEYPILMVRSEEKNLSKLLIPVAAVLLVAILAGGYFFVYQPYFAGQPGTDKGTKATEGESVAQTKPETNGTPAPEKAAAAAPTPTPAADAQPTSQPTATDGATTDAATGQGKFSLQAASFPNDGGAKELREKLIRAGVPAYITSANLAGKGVWYRVRVGRFVTSGDAEKFAVQAKQRAKAAGVNVQLVVCDFNN